MAKKLTYEEVKQYIEVESGSGCLLLSNEYVNSITKLKFQCKCGEIFQTNLNTFKSINKRQCNKCGINNSINKNKLSLNYINKKLYNVNKKLYSKYYDYTNSYSNIIIQCLLCNHIDNYVSLQSALQSQCIGCNPLTCKQCNKKFIQKSKYSRKRNLCYECCFDKSTEKSYINYRKSLTYNKYGDKCVICNISYNSILDYHHLDKNLKENEPFKLIRSEEPIEKVFYELDKCILLCKNCHMLTHQGIIKIPPYIRSFQDFQKFKHEITIPEELLRSHTHPHSHDLIDKLNQQNQINEVQNE
ncbi:MAG: hypothetical protein ACM3O3_12510 [Syntrophothermus sp.]